MTFTFIDLETTGLNDKGQGGLYNGGRILELGVAVTTDEFEIIDSRSWLVQPWPWEKVPIRTRLRRTRWVPNAGYPSPAVVEMHERSGLRADLRDHRVPRVLAELRDWLATVPEWEEGGPMCGASVHFDREWLSHQARYVHDLFSYRNVDINTFRALWPEVGMRLDYPQPRRMHRALPDVEDTIAEFRFWRQALRVDVANEATP